MSFKGAFRALKNAEQHTENSTASITQLPTNILEAFIPGYSLISGFLLSSLGFDVTLVVSFCFLIFGLTTAIKFIWKHAYELFSEHFMSYIKIDYQDDIHDHVMAWIATQKVSQNSKRLIAKTGSQNAWDEDDTVIEEDLDQTALINFNNSDAKVPPTFQPSYGSHYFLHRGRLFQFSRTPKQVISTGGWGNQVIRDDEDVTLSCIGRSTQPIKELIQEARDHYLDKEKSKTVVRRPAPKDTRNRRGLWIKVATRPSRPMHTVVLDNDQKGRVLADINEYLHPSTPRWYANRGIPYRRGYLFHGPAGVGKSSFAWAIAGVFGLDIYCISLVEPSITEEDLCMMFSALPRRCVVLLEDIDSAGLSKREEEQSQSQAEQSIADGGAAKVGAEIEKAFKSVRNKNGRDPDKQGISLSGLLNAIDGVASHEGRVLVMTTNLPDRLDEALIRPGRIDMKVAFTKATRAQIAELFTRMYLPDASANVASEPIKLGAAPAAKDSVRHRTGNKTLTGGNTASSNKTLNGNVSPRSRNSVLTPPENPKQVSAPAVTPASSTIRVESIAAQFAALLPPDIFTPAEIQGFLLTRKKEPMRALNEVEAWRDATVTAKEEKAKREKEGM